MKSAWNRRGEFGYLFSELFQFTATHTNAVVSRLPTSLVVCLVVGFCLLSNNRTIGQDAGSEFRVVRGKYIVLKSDTRDRQWLTQLVESFDAAVPQWERFWNLPAGALDDWRVKAFVMNERQRFIDSGDLSPTLRFPHGFTQNDRVWVVRQPGDYYTRHLLLHEGVHSLCLHQFNGTGPSWYAEGMAEMLAVHQGLRDQLVIGGVPPSREAVPYWGRFKLTSMRKSEQELPALRTVLGYPLDLKGDVESYSWSWAAVMMLAAYPEYRPALLEAATRGDDRSIRFTRSLQMSLASQWPIVQARWRMLVNTMDYGFDWSRERIELSTQDPVYNGSDKLFRVRADQGWQSVGVRFPPGTRLRLTARGQCILDNQPKPWISEPAGVTIQYAGGRPLGQLLVCVLPTKSAEIQTLRPLEIVACDSEREIVLPEHCWLLFRINDHLDGRANNRDGYAVAIESKF